MRDAWKGTLALGLVSIPVRLVNATRDLDIHFREIHATDGSRVRHAQVCEKEDHEVPDDEVARALEVDGKEVIIEDEEIAELRPKQTRTIDIDGFTRPELVDPVSFRTSYRVAPGDESEGTRRAYRLLLKTVSSSGLVGTGTFVMRNQEHLALVRATGEILTLTTLFHADEVRDPGEISELPRTRKNEVDAMIAIVQELSTDWDPGSYDDCYRERLEKVIARKRRGTKIKPPEPAVEPEPETDLMAALEKTLKDMKIGVPG